MGAPVGAPWVRPSVHHGCARRCTMGAPVGAQGSVLFFCEAETVTGSSSDLVPLLASLLFLNGHAMAKEPKRRPSGNARRKTVVGGNQGARAPAASRQAAPATGARAPKRNAAGATGARVPQKRKKRGGPQRGAEREILKYRGSAGRNGGKLLLTPAAFNRCVRALRPGFSPCTRSALISASIAAAACARFTPHAPRHPSLYALHLVRTSPWTRCALDALRRPVKRRTCIKAATCIKTAASTRARGYGGHPTLFGPCRKLRKLIWSRCSRRRACYPVAPPPAHVPFPCLCPCS
jgi:hypothetical protein